MRRTLGGLDEKRLRLVLGLFFLALALPTALLVHKAYGQLKWESFHQLQARAEELTGRIDRQLVDLIGREEARSFADYGFLVVEGDLEASFLQRSPLSELPQGSGIPGLLGYFQIDADGAFSTPLLPNPPGAAAAYGIPASERQQRSELAQDLFNILARNRLLEDRSRETDVLAKSEDAIDRASEPQPGRLGAQRGKQEDPASPRDQAVTTERKIEAAARPSFGSADKAKLAQSGFDRLDLAQESATAAKRAGKKRPAKKDELGLDLRYQQQAEAENAPQALEDRVAKERSQRRERNLLPEPLYPPPAEEAIADEASEVLEQIAATPAPAPSVLPPVATFGDQVPQAAPAPAPSHQAEFRSPPAVKIRMFESELDPFALSLLESGHFVLYRKVWREGRRMIQGALITQAAFLRGLVEEAFRTTALARTSDLAVTHRGGLLSVFSAHSSGKYLSRKYLPNAQALRGALLYRGRLSAPAGDLELVFSVSQLPAGAGAWVVGWLAAILGLVLAGGIYLLYRLGLRQIALTRQQQDFVSSVSHELKTPLTSIRMYGEMLREGWATDERKRTYYSFICAESERLSRLINNVLQLARLTRNELSVELRPVAIGELMGDIAPKLTSQVEAAGFALRIECPNAGSAVAVQVDEDFLTQILINLVDNAVKFSREARHKEILIRCRLERGKELCLSVRDYGPGIPRDQMKRIFRLFYRSGNALTRETMGTGIGLALVRQLVLAMQGRVDAINADPGAELRVFLPVETQPDQR